MLSAVQHQQHFVPEINNDNSKNIRNDKNFRTTEMNEDNEDFYFLGQHLNTSGLLLQEEEEEEEYYNLPNNFEIANRAFYATINKFTRQSCPDASKRRSPPYSFLENWHLHSIYSKSQQTLLGITPVRPAVLLSGDDFMFTPPFIQQDDEEEEAEEEYNEEYMMTDEEEDVLDWDRNEGDATEFYHLSPCPDSNGLLFIDDEEEEDYSRHSLYRQDTTSPSNLMLFETPSASLNTTGTTTATNKYNNEHDYFNHHHTQENSWMGDEHLASHHRIHIQPNDDLLLIQQSGQEQQSSIMNNHVIDIHADDLYLSDSSSSDEQDDDLSSYDITHLYDNSKQTQPIMTRSSSVLSQKSDEASISSSVVSYQSLADILNKNNGIMATTPSLDGVVMIEDVIQPAIVTTRFNKYGSTVAAQSHASHYVDCDTNHDLELGTQQSNTDTERKNIFTRSFIYILSLWQYLMVLLESFFKRLGMSVTLTSTTDEREPLL